MERCRRCIKAAEFKYDFRGWKNRFVCWDHYCGSCRSNEIKWGWDPKRFLPLKGGK